MLLYGDLRFAFPERSRWAVPEVLATRAVTHAERIYLDVPSTGETFTYAQTYDVAQRVGSGLLAGGAAQGDRVVILMPNCSAFIHTWLGSAAAGLVQVPINTAYKGTFLAHQIRSVEPSATVTTLEFIERMADVSAEYPAGHTVYLVDAEPDELSRAGEQLGDRFMVRPFSRLVTSALGELPEVRPQDLGAIFFTSGTTGPSKGVMMSHAHLTLFAEEGAILTRLTDQDTYLSLGPLFHGNSSFLAAYPALLVGARYVMRERFSASNWLSWIRESGATVTNLIGVMMDFIHKQPGTAFDSDNALRCVFAAPTATAILDDFQERFGIEAFVETFGLTETAIPIMAPYGVTRPPGAAGVLVDELFDVKIVDPDTDEELNNGELGELVLRPKYPFTITMGYYGLPEKTAESLRNCWFHTGDGVRRDEDGWYYFVDRLKDSLRRRGENISSYEVEQGLLLHPEVLEAAVVSVPADQEAGEDEVLACVVLAPQSRLTVDDLWRHCDEHIPSFAVPRYLRLVEALPKTPSEKVQKAAIRTDGVGAGAVDRLAGSAR